MQPSSLQTVALLTLMPRAYEQLAMSSIRRLHSSTLILETAHSHTPKALLLVERMVGVSNRLM